MPKHKHSQWDRHGRHSLEGWGRTLPGPLIATTPSPCGWTTAQLLKERGYSVRGIKRRQVRLTNSHQCLSWSQSQMPYQKKRPLCLRTQASPTAWEHSLGPRSTVHTESCGVLRTDMSQFRTLLHSQFSVALGHSKEGTYLFIWEGNIHSKRDCQLWSEKISRCGQMR